MKSQNTASITLASSEPLLGNSSGPVRGVCPSEATESTLPCGAADGGSVARAVGGGDADGGAGSQEATDPTIKINTIETIIHLPELFTRRSPES